MNSRDASLAERITRVEVHLSDTNRHKGGGNDKRCVMEARLAGLGPIAVSEEGATLEQVIEGAAEKLHRALERSVGRLGNARERTSYGGDQTV